LETFAKRLKWLRSELGKEAGMDRPFMVWRLRPRNTEIGVGEVRHFAGEGNQIYLGPCVLMDHPKAQNLSEGDRVEAISVYPNGRFEMGGIMCRAFTCDSNAVTEVADAELMRVLRAAVRQDDFSMFHSPSSGQCCTGREVCRVCTNCTRCEWCRRGGTCGRCAKSKAQK
jgi:hypothetical protein